jgi:hypothetical protein
VPSISDDASRHVVIDHRQGHYLCFTDVRTMDDGSLLVVYNEYDRHVGNRRRLMQQRSKDGGRTWSGPRMIRARRSHCPRLSALSDGQILLMDDVPPNATWSTDEGEHWVTDDRVKITGHGLLDRPLALDTETLLTTGHCHRGQAAHPAIRQAPTEQMLYRSDDRGATWKMHAPIARHRNLVLCEGSLCLLPDGRLACLMRENSMVYEPMYLSLSDDGGNTWSDPIPTPLIGHRPTLGLTPGGKLLVTYRNVGPDWGTAAWLGELDELTSGFRVHGRISQASPPEFTTEGMRVRNGPGSDVTRFALRPMTDPRSATAELEATLRVDRAGQNGCGLRLGCWWRVFPDRVESEGEHVLPLKSGQFNHFRLSYSGGVCELTVNDRDRIAMTVPPDGAETRGIMVGAPLPFEDNEVDCVWRDVKLNVNEPRELREHQFTWDHTQGLPDRWMRDSVLELKNDRHAAWADFGYSGWCVTPDGDFFCAYHHGGGEEPDYAPGLSSRIMGTRFSRDDFK